MRQSSRASVETAERGHAEQGERHERGGQRPEGVQRVRRRPKRAQGVPPISKEPEDSRKHFRYLRDFRDKLEKLAGVPFPALSMGMSADYEIAVEELILPEDYEGMPDAVRAITQRFTSALERRVRLAPEQYFWLHRRWKHQPSKPKRRAVA